MSVALVWLRNDLRLSDNPALSAALDAGHVPVPVYIRDETRQRWAPGAASDWWLHHSLQALDIQLRATGSQLFIGKGNSESELRRLCTAFKASHVFWNRGYEPQTLQRDSLIKTRLRAEGVVVQSFNGPLLREPSRLLKNDGTPYRVFTPFWKALQKLAPFEQATTAPRSLPAVPPAAVQTCPLDSLGLLAGTAWYSEFPRYWQPGERGAERMLQRFLDHALADYPDDRDYPALPGTSRLSPHLHFGELGPRQLWHTMQHWADTRTEPGVVQAAESFLRQLAWREFSHHLLYHFPDTADSPMDQRFNEFPWSRGYSSTLRRWQQGQTGIPIVDAGMRELWQTGWMHNRVRMIAASLLTKNLLIPWQEGARWFWDTLVDADLANNTMGWQWTAGCGADAAPYFRIFNPVRQGERFDPDGSYVRHWVPELAKLPSKWIHQPWAATPDELQKAGISLGDTYPHPIADLQSTRKRCLSVWDQVKNQPR